MDHFWSGASYSGVGRLHYGILPSLKSTWLKSTKRASLASRSTSIDPFSGETSRLPVSSKIPRGGSPCQPKSLHSISTVRFQPVITRQSPCGAGFYTCPLGPPRITKSLTEECKQPCPSKRFRSCRRSRERLGSLEGRNPYPAGPSRFRAKADRGRDENE